MIDPIPAAIKDAARRPIASRSNSIAIRIAAALARSAITPNQISVLSIVFALIGALLLVDASPLSLADQAVRQLSLAEQAVRQLSLADQAVRQLSLADQAARQLSLADQAVRQMCLVGAAICIQLRLLCNLFDGMVAMEGGKASAVGALYNDVPDRIADPLLLIAAGYACTYPELGWLAALLAVLTAYVRLLGASFGLPQDFRGPMAKPQRMAILTLACFAGAAELYWHETTHAITIAIGVIALGALLTCARRLWAIAAKLKQGAQND
jgi:phosphatidylglycerophosphate synthase